MDCRRAFEIDLGGYLRDPRARAWDDFRAHYPRCAACAAEVHAHTEVALLLAPEHPDPERLLRYEDAPASLDPTERGAITTHLAGCVTCRDELSALRRFAPALEEATAAAAPRRAVVERRRWLPAFGEWLWQPAVAWAAVLALVVYSTLGPASRGMFERTIPRDATKDEPVDIAAAPSERDRRFAEGLGAQSADHAAPAERDQRFAESDAAPSAKHAAPVAPPPSTSRAAPAEQPSAPKPSADGLKTRAPEPAPAVQSAPNPSKRTAASRKNEAATAPPAGQRSDVEAKGDAEERAVAQRPSASMRAAEDATPPTAALGGATPSPRGGASAPSDERYAPYRDKALGYIDESPQRRQAAPEPTPAPPDADVSPGGSAPEPARSETGADDQQRPSASAGAAAPPPPPAPLGKEKLSALAARQQLGAVAAAPPIGATLAPRADAADVAALTITAPSPLPSEVEVELRAADGRRRLNERVTSPARTITLSVAADWLEGGPYDVLVRDPSGRVLYTTRVQVRR